MSRSYRGANNSNLSRKLSGVQRHEPEYYTPGPEAPTGINPALPILESINASMTKGTIIEKVDQAIGKLGG